MCIGSGDWIPRLCKSLVLQRQRLLVLALVLVLALALALALALVLVPVPVPVPVVVVVVVVMGFARVPQPLAAKRSRPQLNLLLPCYHSHSGGCMAAKEEIQSPMQTFGIIKWHKAMPSHRATI